MKRSSYIAKLGTVEDPVCLYLRCGHTVRWGDFTRSRLSAGRWLTKGSKAVYEPATYECVVCTARATAELLIGDDVIARHFRAVVAAKERQIDWTAEVAA